jgi:hypothetical protein
MAGTWLLVLGCSHKHGKFSGWLSGQYFQWKLMILVYMKTNSMRTTYVKTCSTRTMEGIIWPQF